MKKRKINKSSMLVRVDEEINGERLKANLRSRPCLGTCGGMYANSTPYNRICPTCTDYIDCHSTPIFERYSGSTLSWMGIENIEQEGRIA